MRPTTDTPRTAACTALASAVSRCAPPRRTVAGLLVAAVAPLVALVALSAPAMAAATLAGALVTAAVVAARAGDGAPAVGHPGRGCC